MRKLKFISLFVLIISQITLAQTTHNLSRTFDLEYRVSGGYSYLNSSFNNTKEIGGTAFSAGINGEFAFNFNWIVQIGGEYSHFNSSVSPFDFTEQRNLIDTEGDAFTMNYTYSQFTQRQHLGCYYLPVSFGYKTTNFYALAGIKFGIPIYSKYSTKIRYFTTEGDYSQFIDDFTNMPNHYFVSEKKSFTNNFSFNKNVSVSARIGNQFKVKSSNPLVGKTFRVGLFADIGLSNIQQRSDVVPLISYGYNPVNIHPNNIVNTNLSLKNTLRSTIVGVEISFLIQYYTKYKCNCK